MNNYDNKAGTTFEHVTEHTQSGGTRAHLQAPVFGQAFFSSRKAFFSSRRYAQCGETVGRK